MLRVLCSLLLYLHTHIYTYLYVRIVIVCMYVYVHEYACMCVCMYVRTYERTYVCTHARMHAVTYRGTRMPHYTVHVYNGTVRSGRTDEASCVCRVKQVVLLLHGVFFSQAANARAANLQPFLRFLMAHCHSMNAFQSFLI